MIDDVMKCVEQLRSWPEQGISPDLFILIRAAANWLEAVAKAADRYEENQNMWQGKYNEMVVALRKTIPMNAEWGGPLEQLKKIIHDTELSEISLRLLKTISEFYCKEQIHER